MNSAIRPFQLMVMLAAIGVLLIHAAHTPLAASEFVFPQDDGKSLRLSGGFEAEQLYRVPAAQGSWVSIAHDPQGRLIASDQYGQLYRVTPGEEVVVEPIDVKIGRAHGLLCAFDCLYVMAHPGDGQPGGLYRVRDTDGDDQYDSVELLRKIEGSGEHGPHAIILSPDKKSLYVCAGNHTKLPKLASSRVPQLWAEDQVLPRMWDAGGHAVGIKAPGGWICRADPDGKSFELLSMGFRNQYDIAIDPNGELFTYDADMEWDVGLPWYRPTRVCHATSGSEFGWRSGTGKWPSYYADSLPAAVDVGPGSPTGIAFGTGAKFPAKYQRALFISDWSYGIIYAVHLEPAGASFSGTFELFCSAPALPVTDLVINQADGAMYFLVGGRRAQSALYRVTYKGPESVEAADYPPPTELARLRREIESLDLDDPSTAIDQAWKYLNHSDRFIRFAARTVVERQPIEGWAGRAVAEADRQGSLEAIMALARAGGAKHQTDALDALGRINWRQLTMDQKLHLLRNYGLIHERLGPLSDESVTLFHRLSEFYPSDDSRLNYELARLLVAVDAPSVVDKTIRLLEAEPTQEGQIHYALCLSTTQTGWTRKLREEYFGWFLNAARLYGGNSFSGFLKKIRERAIETLTDQEKEDLAELLDQQPATKDPYADLSARPVIRKWTMEELLPIEKSDFRSRDLENGKRVFSIGQCFKCHRISGEGGIVGPDLTAAGRRFTTRDLLETLIDPNKEISDQYRATVFQLEDGRTITGRVANLTGNQYLVQTDMINPGKLTRVNVDQIEAVKPSAISMMPAGLLDSFTRDEILDLLAYMKSTSPVK